MVSAGLSPIGDATRAIVIGASAGALDALGVILPAVPACARAAVVVVVHIPASAPSLLASIFGPRCQVPVVEIEDKMTVAPATIFFAPPDYHVLVERDHTLSLSRDAPVNFSRPSIDVLFESAAEVYGPHLVGVVLTGASADGARGLEAIEREGGVCVVQTPSTAEASTMPAAALVAAPSATALDLPEMARWLSTIPTEAP